MSDKGAVALIGLLSLPFVTVLRGYVLSVLWSLFAVPLGARPISVALACGVSFLAAYLTYNTDAGHELRSERQQHEYNVRLLVTAWFVPPIALVVGKTIAWLGGLV